MTSLSETPLGEAWLAHFVDDSERATASALMDEILLVDRTTFLRGVRSLVEAILKERADPERPIALFSERAVPKRAGKALPFFPGTETARATGPGVPPIEVDPNDQEVGSEGLIANLITNLVRHHGADVLSHPGPTRMRRERVRNIVIVTDFIGSGKRVWEMLEAFRAVATLRSWRSYGLITFNVVAYSGTEQGVRHVRSSRLKPEISMVTGCPTLWSTFSGTRLRDVQMLCRTYPRRHRWPFGFLSGGALIAFAHGMPNNAPAILHSSLNNWTPLFRKRSTVAAEMSFPRDAIETVADRAARLLRIANATKFLANPNGKRWVTTMMALAALKDGARSAGEVSAQTGLQLSQIEEILGYTRIVHWTTERNRLTALGRRELERLRRRRDREPILSKSEPLFYYPTQLRAR
ncbi:phosphoribosyltransferase-like protein [Bradyrhizobium sp. BR 1433]|uniref:phosphoribosyltransferase-like protein n=1 Tax=Bradyrhizobium sp. BR 1433 TaxID=3447967 RepID=UPI003EE755A0